MTAKTATPQAPFGAITAHRLASLAFDLVDGFRRWRETRRTVTELRALTRTQLDDIGLTPGDVEQFARTGRF